MKVKVDLSKIVLEKEIKVISKHNGLFNNQGMPIYEVLDATGKVYFDKEQFTNKCLEVVKKEYEALRFDVELEFKCEITTTCKNGFEWTVDVFGDVKEDDNENVYFEYLEVV